MTDFNKRVESLLQKRLGDFTYFNQSGVEEISADLTQLFIELAESAKPEKKQMLADSYTPLEDDVMKYGYNQAVDDFATNLMKGIRG